MSVVIPTPPSTEHVTVTLHLESEQAVINEARHQGVEPTYLPSEGPHAALIMAEFASEPDVSITMIARIGR
jgi:hypothetical protein